VAKVWRALPFAGTLLRSLVLRTCKGSAICANQGTLLRNQPAILRYCSSCCSVFRNVSFAIAANRSFVVDRPNVSTFCPRTVAKGNAIKHFGPLSVMFASTKHVKTCRRCLICLASVLLATTTLSTNALTKALSRAINTSIWR
jgi:hypothetical protein